MALVKRGNDDPLQPQGNSAGAPRSGLIKRDSVVHEAGPPEPVPPPQEPGQIRIVGDPTASARPAAAFGAAPAAPAAPRPQAAANAAAEKAILDKANAEAAALVKDAMEKTEALKKKVQAELQAAIEANNERCQEAFLKAQEDGYARGQQEALETVRTEFMKVMEEARNVLTQAMAGREALIRSATGEIAKLALRVAERVIGAEVNINEDVVIHTIQSALEKIKSRESVVVRCNPTDVEYVKMNKDIFTRMVEGLKQFEVQADAKVERGGCIIETNLGNVDARIQTQMAVLQLAFGDVEKQQNADS